MEKRLDNPEEFARVKAVYFEPVFTSDLPNEELMDRQVQKEKLKRNQAR